MSRNYSRRELASVVGGGALAMFGRRGQAAGRVPHPGRVGLAAIGEGEKLGPEAARRLIDQALSRAVADTETGVAAAKRLFKDTDTVGIKLNCLAGPMLSPRVELVEALVEVLVEAGVARRRVIVFERSSRELERAGFPVRRRGGAYLCYGTDNDYDDTISESGAIGSCFARLVSKTCSALISFGVVKDHDLAGVSAGLKNWYGVIHNPNKYHDNNCDPYVADIVRHPFLKSKIRLTVLDGLRAQYHGGPALNPEALFPLGRVAASADPVAADLWAWGEIDAERARRGLPSLEADGRPPKFIATAGGYGLGAGDPSRLHVVRA